MTKRQNSSLHSSSDRSFEDDEKMAVELKVIIFNTRVARCIKKFQQNFL